MKTCIKCGVDISGQNWSYSHTGMCGSCSHNTRIEKEGQDKWQNQVIDLLTEIKDTLNFKSKNH